MLSGCDDIEVTLVGAGPMAIAYARVLDELAVRYQVIGRGRATAENFERETGTPVITGGIHRWLQDANRIPPVAIVAVGPSELAATAEDLLKAGVRRILLEKPAALNLSALTELVMIREQTSAEVFVAYNRRHYASTLRAAEIIAEDGGVLSSSFVFSRCRHLFTGTGTPKAELAQWFFLNSSHVVDLAFHLGGKPVSMKTWAARGLDWHPSASVFAGSGVTDREAVFSYHANWEAPGRWGVDIMTGSHRLVLRPLERLRVQAHGKLAAEEVSLDDDLDQRFKPGLFRQVEEFLSPPSIRRTPTLDDHYRFWREVLALISSPEAR